MYDPNTVHLERLKKRKDFLAARNGVRERSRYFSMQAIKRSGQTYSGDLNKRKNTARIGFTVTRKTGNAVARNRIKRRLREVVRLNAATCVRGDSDYVLIARDAILNAPFPALVREFVKSANRISQKMPSDIEAQINRQNK